MFALLKRGSEYSIKLLLGVNIRANIFRMEKQNITISHEDMVGDMGVYGIAGIGLFFMRYFGNFDFNVRYAVFHHFG